MIFDQHAKEFKAKMECYTLQRITSEPERDFYLAIMNACNRLLRSVGRKKDFTDALYK